MYRFGSYSFGGNDEDEEDDRQEQEAFCSASPVPFLPSKDCKFVESSYYIPTCCDVAGDEDTESQYREGVH